MLAPVVIFTYNRPRHLQETVNALKNNELAVQTDLYIFSDAPKNIESELAVVEVRNYLKSIDGFKSVSVVERPFNYGLAQSIIRGVTEVLEKHETIIVLEDDIVPSPGFLLYMNGALDLYKDDFLVGCVHAWNYELDIGNYPESTFFLKGADCWGWATWRRAWHEFNPNGTELLELIKSRGLEYEFNRNGTHPFVEMLGDQINGKNDSWAIRWHASLFVKNMFCLNPVRPIVKNIGFDNFGTNCYEAEIQQTPVDIINLKKIPVNEEVWYFNSYSKYLKKNSNHHISLWLRLKILLKRVFLQ